MTAGLSALQFFLITLTVTLVTGAGMWAARSVRSAAGYSLGGRQAGAALVAGSIAGTCVGGGATVGTAQLASVVGLPALWFTLGVGISLVIMAVFYARPLRETELETIPQYLALNYGKRAEAFAGLVSSFGILFSAVASCLPGIRIVSLVSGLPLTESALIFTVLVAAYGFFGGMKSAGVGGILKMAVIWLSLAAAGASAFMEMRADPALSSALPGFGIQSLFGDDVAGCLANLASLIVGMICTQTYIQAIFSAKGPRTAAMGALIAALIVIPVGLPCVAIGIYMHAVHPDVSPILVMPVYLLSYQPTVTGSVAMGGILLSLVSSSAGLALGIGTMVSRDILPRFLPKTDDRGELARTRAVVLAVMALASVIAIVNVDSQVLFWNYLSMALRGGGIFLPFTIAIFRPGAIAPFWALCSMVASTLAAIAASFLKSPVHPLFVGLIVSLLLIIPGIIRKGAKF